MANYQARLDRIEATISPRTEPSFLLVVNNIGQTKEQAVEAYAEAHGLTVTDLRATRLRGNMIGV